MELSWREELDELFKEIKIVSKEVSQLREEIRVYIAENKNIPAKVDVLEDKINSLTLAQTVLEPLKTQILKLEDDAEENKKLIYKAVGALAVITTSITVFLNFLGKYIMEVIFK